MERARLDLERGHPRRARERLQGVLVARPYDLQARALLGEAYRRDGQWAEAGRWGYLVRPAASECERVAFERHAAFGWRRRIERSRLRHLLRVDELESVADEAGIVRLRTLGDWRRPGDPGPLVERLGLARWVGSVVRG
ncbi:hypothetical protein D5H78_18640 [Vallicoccus soli]|uniref:Tetratricopeptide repeat protein n=1 Tax=Vallicoccus soli TaxID=2339232 RepID=A0A3A3YMK3_9ACTN|nr:hypothetical protein D5H78_18640 [Vallicoccus soli]